MKNSTREAPVGTAGHGIKLPVSVGEGYYNSLKPKTRILVPIILDANNHQVSPETIAAALNAYLANEGAADNLCAGGVKLSSEPCPKCGATMDDGCLATQPPAVPSMRATTSSPEQGAAHRAELDQLVRELRELFGVLKSTGDDRFALTCKRSAEHLENLISAPMGDRDIGLEAEFERVIQKYFADGHEEYAEIELRRVLTKYLPVEELIDEALEKAATLAARRWRHWRAIDLPDDLEGVEACDDIAAAIRQLKHSPAPPEKTP